MNQWKINSWEINRNASFLSYLAQTEDLERNGERYSFDLNDFVYKIENTKVKENNIRVNAIIYWQYTTLFRCTQWAIL